MNKQEMLEGLQEISKDVKIYNEAMLNMKESTMRRLIELVAQHAFKLGQDKAKQGYFLSNPEHMQYWTSDLDKLIEDGANEYKRIWFDEVNYEH